MSRSIKFRAWDKLDGKFLNPWPDGFTILGETTCFDLIMNQMGELHPEKLTLNMLNDVGITQFTGIKDIDGAEIYEGDILIVTGEHKNTGALNPDKNLPVGRKYKIVFHDGCFKLKRTKRTKMKVLSGAIIYQNGMKVIGNIYKNP